jgi:hypothetical protein
MSAAARYVFFIAHAGRDLAYARSLHERLQGVGRVFLDAVDLEPGAQWDVELPERQRQSAATLALISASTDAAYYLREEIAGAIAYQRHDPTGHRLVPIFLDGRPADPARVPYGIRALDSLDAAQLGLDGLVAELRRLADVLRGQAPPGPPPAPPPVDRFALYDALCRLLPPQFDEVMFRTDAPRQHLAPPGEPQARRALDLVQWSEQGAQAGLEQLAVAVRKVAPSILRPG